MLLKHWLSRKSVRAHKRKSAVRQRPQRRHRATQSSGRAAIESLEERTLLAAFSWNSDTDGNWNDQANWNDGVSGVPGNADDVTIDRGIANPVITVDSDARIESLVASEAIVISDAELRVDAASDLQIVTIANGGELDLDGAAVLNNQLNWQSGALSVVDLTIANGAVVNASTAESKTVDGVIHNEGRFVQDANLVTGNLIFNNQSDGIWEINGGQTWAATNGTPSFNNHGLLKKTGVGESSFLPGAFGRRARFLHLDGTVQVDAGKLILASSDISSTGGDFIVAQDAVLDLTGGSNVNYAGTYTGSGAGRVEFSAGQIESVGGAAVLDFAPGLFHWTGGQFFRDITNDGHVTIDGAGGQNLSNRFTNNGTVVQLPGSILDSSSTGIVNASGATWELQGDATIGVLSTTDKFQNFGTLRKTGAGTATIVSGLSHHSGTIDVQQGILTADHHDANDSTGANFVVADGSEFLMTGSIDLTGTFTGAGDGRVEFSSGQIESVGNAAILDFTPGMFHWTGGQLFRDITNVGDVTVAGDGGQSLTNRFTSSGTVTQLPGSVLGSSSTGIVNSGVWELQGDAKIVGTNGFATDKFQNFGTLRKTGVGTATIDEGLSHHGGTIDVQQGVLDAEHHDGVDSEGGHFVVATDSAFLIAGTIDLIGTFTGAGDGRVEFSSGQIESVDNSAVLDMPAGLFHWTGGEIFRELTNTGDITIEGDGGQTFSSNFTNTGTITQLPNSSVAIRDVFNTETAVWELQDNAAIIGSNAFATNELRNSGIVRKTGPGTATISGTGAALSHHGGMAEVVEGTLTAAHSAAAPGTGGHFVISAGAVFEMTGRFQSDGVYTAEGAGDLQINGTVYGDDENIILDFPEGMATVVVTDSIHHKVVNQGHLTLGDAEGWQAFGWLRNDGTIVQQPGVDVLMANYAAVVNHGVWELQGDATWSLRTFDGLSADVSNFGVIRKTGSGTSTMINDPGWLPGGSGSPVFSNSGTVEVLGGSFDIESELIQQLDESNETLHGGSWLVRSGSTLEFADESGNMPAISTLLGDVTLDGIGSTFANVDSLEMVDGRFEITNGRDFATVGNLTNGVVRTDIELKDVLYLGSGNPAAVAVAGGTLITHNRSERIDGEPIFRVGDPNGVEIAAPIIQPGGPVSVSGLDVTSTPVNVGGTNVPVGSLLFIHSAAEPPTLYAMSLSTGEVLASVELADVGRNQAGVTLHPTRGTVFVVGTNSTVTEVNAQNGSTVNSFSVSPFGSPSFSFGTWGGIDAASDGSLLITGSQRKLRNLSPAGDFVRDIDLSVEGMNRGLLSDVSVDDVTGEVWVSVATGYLYRFSGISTGTQGEIAAGSGSTLTVTGDYTQTGTASFGFGGNAASGQFGTIAITGTASLAGGANFETQNNFVPGEGEVYDVMTFTSKTGDLTFGGNQDSFDPFLDDTVLRVNSLAGAADLTIDSVTVPSSGVANDDITVSYTARNLTGGTTSAAWTDSVYLSADSVLDPGDILIARVEHTGVVNGGATYTESVTAPLPGAFPADYHVIVVADSRGNSPDANRANNSGTSVDIISLDIPSLTPGVVFNGNIAAGQEFYFRTDLSTDLAPSIKANFASPGTAEVFVRQGQFPTRTIHDHYAFSATDQSVTVTQPAGRTGTFFILVRGTAGAGDRTGSSFSLVATDSLFGITRLATTRGSNTGLVSTFVKGSLFTEESTFELVSGTGIVVEPVSTQLLDNETAWVTFDLAGSAVGTYDILANDGSNQDILTDAFEVIAGDVGQVVFDLSVPAAVRSPFRSTQIIVTYENIGDNDVVAPLFTVVGDNARMRLPDQLSWSVDSIEVLGGNPDGLAGVLPPGSKGSIHIQFEPLDSQAGAVSNFTVSPAGIPEDVSVPDGESEMQWDSRREDLRPPAVNQDAWAAIFDNFKSAVGLTYESFHQQMASNASYLASIGLPTSSLARLMAWEFEKAGNFGEIEKNYFSGVIGQQPYPAIDSRAIVDANGNVTLTFGSEIRGFVLQGSTFVAAGTNDTAHLSIDAAGDVRLLEADGIVLTYRAEDGRLVTIDDPREGETSISIDAQGLATSLTAPNGDITQFRYNAAGQIGRITDGVERVTNLTYDSAGRLASVNDSSGTTQYSYFSGIGAAREGALESTTRPDGTKEINAYDANGRLVMATEESTDGQSIPTQFAWSNQGAVTLTDASGNKTTMHRGPGGTVAATTNAQGGTTQFGVTADSRITSITGTDGEYLQLKFGNDILLDEIIDPAGNPTSLEYDSGSGILRLDTITDVRGATTDYDYDSAGNLTQIKYTDGTFQTSQFDTRGNQIVGITAAGERIEYAYNAANLLTLKTLPDGSSVVYGYDVRRNLTSVAQRDSGLIEIGTTTFTYDDADRVLSATYPNGTSLTLTYDDAGRRTSATDQAGSAIKHDYDSFGRLHKVSSNAGNGAGDQLLVTYAYDSAGRLLTETRGNGAVTEYSYDELNRIERIEHRDADGNVIEQFVHTFENDLLVRLETLAGTTDYQYDVLGQLTKVSLPDGRSNSYSYDRDGNRTQANDDGNLTTHSANLMDQYTSVGTARLSYDGNGSLTEFGSDASYEYDVEGRLLKASADGQSVEYVYDGLGNRIATVRDGVRIDLLVDPVGLSTLFGEYETGGSAIYAQGNGITARVDGDAAQFYHYDLVGNTQLLTNESAAVSDSYDYLPFGELVSRTGTSANPFTFNGQVGITESGVPNTYYMRNRNYSAELGRFLEIDPIDHQSGETNLYRFVRNNPVTNTDPSGLISIIGLAKRFEAALPAPIQGGLAGLAFKTGFTGALSTTQLGSNVTAVLGHQSVATATGIAVRTGGVQGAKFFVSKTAVPLYLAAVGGFHTGRAIDKKTDQLFPELKNDFRNTLANSSLQPGNRPDSPIYDTGGVVDSRYNEFLTDAMEDPAVSAVAKLLIKSGGYTPEEALERAHTLVKNHEQSKKKKTEVVRPRDPNNIVGPAGARADIPGDPEIQRVRFDGYVRPSGVYQYDIHYENKSSATAPAQTVVVTHTIDEDLDLNTLEVNAFGFGDTMVTVPAGRSNYFERVDVSDTLNVVVDFEATLDPSTRELTITLTSLDPETLDFPIDPFAGFLPPNVTAPEGDGFIRFSIEPKSDLPDGTRIDGLATIIFDTEDPIETPAVHNTIDDVAPTSQVDPLPTTSMESFVVSITGDDGTGSGVANFDVYVSDDDGPFTLWESTSEPSLTFTGELDHTYRFYSVATDRVGLIEIEDAHVDASTTVVAASSKAILDIDGDDQTLPLTDGLLALRHMAGFTGEALIDGAVAEGVTAEQVESYLASIAASLDVDGDGQANSLTDGILIIRRLAKFEGNPLINNAVNPQGTRTSAADVTAWIDALTQTNPGAAASQVVSAFPTQQMVAGGNPVSVQVNYDIANSSDTDATGLDLRMHYNANDLTLNSLSPRLQHGFIAQQTFLDEEDYDDDPTTTHYLSMLWLDAGGAWPDPVSTSLFTAGFIASSGFESANVNFTGSSAAGFNLVTHSATIGSVGLVIDESDGQTVVTEVGGEDVVDVRLSGQPIMDVVVTVSGDANDEFTTETTQLTFTPENWNTPQRVTVRGVDDAVLDGTIVANLEFSIGSNAVIQVPVSNLDFEDEVNLVGTPGNDTLLFTATDTMSIRFNGNLFEFQSDNPVIRFDGMDGYDSVTVTAGGTDIVAVLRPDSLSVAGSTFDIETSNTAAHRVTNLGNGGELEIFGSDLADTVVIKPDVAWIKNDISYGYGAGFSQVVAASSDGTDSVQLYDGPGDDELILEAETSVFTGDGFSLTASGFESVAVFSRLGTDTAEFFDTEADDTYVAKPGVATMQSPGLLRSARGFSKTTAWSTAGGRDSAELFDSADDDLLVSRFNHTYIVMGAIENHVRSFETVRAFATLGGVDEAQFYDTTGSDRFVAKPTYAYIYNRTGTFDYLNYQRGFERVRAFSTKGGADQYQQFSGLDYFFSKSDAWELAEF